MAEDIEPVDDIDDIEQTEEHPEIVALRAQLAAKDSELEAANALLAERDRQATALASSGFHNRGRYLVSVEDGPPWIVEVENGEHPFDIYKKKVGMISSPHNPTITKVADDARLGDPRVQVEV